MRLEVLRRYRAQAEESVRLELAEVDARLATMARERAQRRQVADAQAAAYLASTRRGGDAVELAMAYQAWEGLEHEVKRAESLLVRTAEERERKQTELAIAIRERKQMDMLAQRQARQRERIARRGEQREMDDFANGRWAMAMRGWEQGDGTS